MQADPAALSSVGQIHISVADLARAVAFYRDALGLPLLFEVPAQSMAFFDCGGVRLYIGVPSQPDYRSTAFLYYRVGDIDAAYARLKERGVTFQHPPRLVHRGGDVELWMAGFQDPDGNWAQIMEERRAA